MLEREVAANFNTIFAEYSLLVPVNTAASGWPDRLIQLELSRIVAVEIKNVKMLKRHEIRFADFRPSQAAWLAKWQKAHGKCFLFVGITSFTNEFIGYGILTVDDWREWLKLPNELITLDTFDFVSNEHKVILNWFKSYVEIDYA